MKHCRARALRNATRAASSASGEAARSARPSAHASAGARSASSQIGADTIMQYRSLLSPSPASSAADSALVFDARSGEGAVRAVHAATNRCCFEQGREQREEFPLGARPALRRGTCKQGHETRDLRSRSQLHDLAREILLELVGLRDREAACEDLKSPLRACHPPAVRRTDYGRRPASPPCALARVETWPRSFAPVPERGECTAEIGVGIRVTWRDRDGPPVVRNRLVHATEPGKHQGDVVVILRNVAIGWRSPGR